MRWRSATSPPRWRGVTRWTPTTARGAGASLPWASRARANDVAAAALFLAGTEARFITGQCLAVDGGVTAVAPLMGLSRMLQEDARGDVLPSPADLGLPDGT